MKSLDREEIEIGYPDCTCVFTSVSVCCRNKILLTLARRSFFSSQYTPFSNVFKRIHITSGPFNSFKVLACSARSPEFPRSRGTEPRGPRRDKPRRLHISDIAFIETTDVFKQPGSPPLILIAFLIPTIPHSMYIDPTLHTAYGTTSCKRKLVLYAYISNLCSYKRYIKI